MKSCYALAIAALTLFSTGANAITWLRCDSCDAYSAEAYSRNSGYRDEVVVFNLPAATAFKFVNELEIVGENCQPNSVQPGNSKKPLVKTVGCHFQVVATPIASDAGDLSFKGALVDFYNATGGTLQANIEIQAQSVLPAPGPVTGANGGSAYDFVNNLFFRAQMTNAARAASSTVQMIASWKNLTDIITTAIGTQLVGMDGSRLTVEIYYPDSSKTVVFFDKRMHIVSKDSYSAEGLDIISADTLRQFVGHVIFNNAQSLQNFFDTLNFLNVPVTSSYYQLPQTGSCHSILNGISCIRPR
jgi:hypothetical protein